MEYGLIFHVRVSGVTSVEYGQIFHVMRIGKYYCKNKKYRISNWASEASPTLGCSIEISRDICCRYVVCLSYVVCRMSYVVCLSYVKLTA